MAHIGPVQECTDICLHCMQSVHLNVECISKAEQITKTGQQALSMALGHDDLTTGEYVYDALYLQMRLRMKLTGTASPTEEVWVKALRKLLNALDSGRLSDVFE